MNMATPPGVGAGISPCETTIAKVLSNDGYGTAMFGKWHMSDVNESEPQNMGFDEFFGQLYHFNAYTQTERIGYDPDSELGKPIYGLVEAKTCMLVFTAVCMLSLAYPFFVTFVAETTMPYQAHGNLIYVNGTVVGSELLGQNFTSPGYFHGRPSAVDYNGSNSVGSNLGPTSAKLMDQVRQRVEMVRRENNLPPNATVPADLVLASGSGLDPYISPKSAIIQVRRVARARGLGESDVKALVEDNIEAPQLGIFGQERINVLKLNIALDDLARKNAQ